MKKLLLTLVVLCLCMSMAATLASCGGDSGTEPQTEAQTTPAETNPVETNPAETNPAETDPVETKPADSKPAETNPTKPAESTPVDSKPAETKPTESTPSETKPAEPKPEPVYTVTQSEWESNFQSTNYTFEIENSTVKQLFRYNADEIEAYMEYPSYDFTIRMMWVLDQNEVWWQYEEYAFEGDWEKGLDEERNGARMRAELVRYYQPLANVFSSFTYNEESKQYTAASVTLPDGDDELVLTDLCASFENGVLVSLTYSFESFGLLSAVKVYDVETTTAVIPVPQYGATEDQWNQIMTSDDLNNLRIYIEAYSEKFGIFDSVYYQYCESAIESGRDYAIKNENGKWIEYTWDINEYNYVTTEVSEEYVIDKYFLKNTLGALLANQYGYFVYDVESKFFVIQNIAFGDKMLDEVRILIRNGKLVLIEADLQVTIDNQTDTATYTIEFGSYGMVDAEDITPPIKNYQ